jgi:hypothetical protein
MKMPFGAAVKVQEIAPGLAPLVARVGDAEAMPATVGDDRVPDRCRTRR